MLSGVFGCDDLRLTSFLPHSEWGRELLVGVVKSWTGSRGPFQPQRFYEDWVEAAQEIQPCRLGEENDPNVQLALQYLLDNAPEFINSCYVFFVFYLAVICIFLEPGTLFKKS